MIIKEAALQESTNLEMLGWTDGFRVQLKFKREDDTRRHPSLCAQDDTDHIDGEN